MYKYFHPILLTIINTKKNISLRFLLFLLLFGCFTSCVEESEKHSTGIKSNYPEQIVIISTNAPGKYAHLLKQDSLGKKLKDSVGPKMFLPHYGFSYLDNQNVVQTWIPKKGTHDTLVIPYFKEYLELATHNPYTSIKETFLVKNGDTVIFDYEQKLPVAKVTNRQVNDTALNYNRYRWKRLFKNKYSSHRLIFTGVFLEGIEEADRNTIKHYLQAREDYNRERKLLDSLRNFNIISETDLQYRINALDVLMEKHKRFEVVQRWLNKKQIFDKEGEFSKAAVFDLKYTDSLMTYSFFRNHLKNISQYKLSRITENNGSSGGGSYIDSRKRFDSILQDNRFNQRAKDFLLFDAYNGIGQNFRIKDKQEYFEKLQKETKNPVLLKNLVAEYNLNFQESDKLILTTRKSDTLTYANVLKQNQGKWLFVDFWASWCAPCRSAMPASSKLKKQMKNENVEFLYISINDDKENWKAAIISDSIQDGQHYFGENSNTSGIMEELGVITIPHYIIYNPKGEIVNGFADRPGRGAKKQLESYLSKQ